MIGPYCPCHRPILTDNRTPTTLHHLTSDIRYISLYISLSLFWHHPPLSDRTNTVPAAYTSTNDLHSCPPYHSNSTTCDTRIVKVKYLYIRSISTHRDHSEHNPLASTKDSNPWETPINRWVPHYLRYRLIFFSKTLLLHLPLTDLRIRMPLADTPPVSPLLRCASLL